LRTIQYFSRFYAWYLFRTNHPQSAIAPFDAAKKQLGAGRKLLRLGKFIEHFKAAAQAADAKSTDPIVKYLAVSRQLGYAGYLSLDNLTVVSNRWGRRFAPCAKEGSVSVLTGLGMDSWILRGSRSGRAQRLSRGRHSGSGSLGWCRIRWPAFTSCTISDSGGKSLTRRRAKELLRARKWRGTLPRGLSARVNRPVPLLLTAAQRVEYHRVAVDI
jgi:hypothetical protein